MSKCPGRDNMPDETWFRNNFLSQAKVIWKSSLIDKLSLDVVIRDQKYYMSLGYLPSQNPMAFDDTLVRMPSHATLYVSTKLMDKPTVFMMALLRHEAVHLGYPRHDEGFRKVCQLHNIPMTESNYEKGEFEVMRKEGSRYVLLKSFKTFDEANNFATQQAGANPGTRYRIRY